MAKSCWILISVVAVACTSGSTMTTNSTLNDSGFSDGSAENIGGADADIGPDGSPAKILADASKSDSAVVDGPVDAGSVEITASDSATIDNVAKDASVIDGQGKDVSTVDATTADFDSGANDASGVDTATTDAAKDSAPSGIGGPCSAEQQCLNFPCIAPGQFVGCGMCQKVQDVCTSDAECVTAGDKFICKPVICACSGESACTLGCTKNDDCKTGEFCAPTGKCVALVCKKIGDDDASCPANFTCADPGNPKCGRKPCVATTDCAKWLGTCVNGHCHSKPGQCLPPPP
ncbi:MAG: hypothetical protein EXR77_09490 [Myxococcales bacterium]|nr:hypothetical protein [Myxococcales bacterium]